MKHRIILLILMAIGLSLMGLSLVKREPRVLYNPSQSAPIGWYKIEPADAYSVGDRVAAFLPNWAENLAHERGYFPRETPVIKTILAGPRDRYCVSENQLTVDGHTPLEILLLDSKGREMPVLQEGCRSLKAGEFLLHSDRSAVSFDSRYFGAIDRSAIIGKAVFLGDAEAEIGGKSRPEGGARGPGAQGKIKEGGAIRCITSCLHINFYGAVNFAMALTGPMITCDHSAKDQRQCMILHDHTLMR